MIKNLTEDTALKFKSLSNESKSEKGILGRLYGQVASCASPTRNGRKYTQDLWEKLFESDLIKERFQNGGIFGELTHPDREEIDFEKVAIVMPEPPVKDKDGRLVAYVDILDTPCGRIAYQLAKYGYKFGISSRGTGDIIDGVDGEEVDPDTYQLNAFDLVEIPAVESARLAFTEALDTKKLYNKTLKERLTEEFENASDEDKAIMEEALDNFNIKLNLNEGDEVVNDKALDAVKDDFAPPVEEMEKELEEKFYLRHEDIDKARDALLNKVDHEELLNALLAKNMKDQTIEDLCRQFGVEDKEFGYNIMTRDEMRDQFGTDNIEDLLKDESIDENYPSITNDEDAKLVYEDDKVIVFTYKGHKLSVHKDKGDQDYDIDRKIVQEIESISESRRINEKWLKKRFRGRGAFDVFFELDPSLTDEEAKDPGFGEKPIWQNFYNTRQEAVEDVLVLRNIERKYGVIFTDEREHYWHTDDIFGCLGENENDIDKALKAADIYISKVTNESISESCGDKEVVAESAEAGNAGDELLVNELQETLLRNKELTEDNLSLQEKLSVCNAKEVKLEEELARYKDATINLSKSAKEVKHLNEELENLNRSLEKKDNIIKVNKEKLHKLIKEAKEANDKAASLEEKLNNVDSDVKKLNEQLESVNDKYNASKLVIQKYQRELKESRDSFIQSKADAYGVKKEDVLSQLTESFKLNEVDSVCKKLSERNYAFRKLPFQLNENVSIDIKGSKNEYIKGNQNNDDYVSDELLRLVNLK